MLYVWVFDLHVCLNTVCVQWIPFVEISVPLQSHDSTFFFKKPGLIDGLRGSWCIHGPLSLV